MTNQPYLYDPQANVLRQQAEMKKPAIQGKFPGVVPEWDKYIEHIKSLPAYTPVSGWVPEVGKEYYEGKDFQVQNKDENDRCPECGHEEYEDEGFLGKGFRVCAKCHQEWWLDVKYNSIYSKLAVPIEQKREEVRAFTLQDMIECWEEGRKSGFWTPILSRTDKKQYFKSKGIDLP